MKTLKTALLIFFLSLSFLSVLQFWQIKPAQATTTFSNGFEEGQLNPSPGLWSANKSGTVQGTTVYAGSYAASLTVASAGPYIEKSISVYEVWTQFQWRCNSLPASDGDSMNVWSFQYYTRTAPYLSLKLIKSSGSVKWDLNARNNSAWVDNSTTTNVPSINTWYLIEIHLKAGSGTGSADFWVEGVKTLCFNSLTNDDREQITSAGPDALKDAGSTTPIFYYDNVVFADAYVGMTPTAGDGVASSWTYRVSKNSTKAYLINNTGAIWDSNTDPFQMINNAIFNASSLGGGSVYVYPDTYNSTTSLGNQFTASNMTDVYVQFGPGTILNATGSTTFGNLLDLRFNSGNYGENVTFTSNGTAYFYCNSYQSGSVLFGFVNSTFSNIEIRDSKGAPCIMRWIRYSNFSNLTFWNFNTVSYDNAAFSMNDVDNNNFENITIDGNNEPKTRGCVYIGDWEPAAGWTGSYFNTWTRIWLKNVRRTGFYLNSGVTSSSIYNNTFTNCTVENNFENAYNAIKLRPAQNNTFSDIIIRNWTDPITTGTAYSDGEVGNSNCTDNNVQATIYNSTNTCLILTADDNDQEVSGNIFNLTVFYSKAAYISQGTTSQIKSNTIYMNMTDCTYGIHLETGNFSANTFYLNFSNCGSGGYADIWHETAWTNITDNTFNVYATSGNPNGLYDFVNGTQNNYVYYPYTYAGISIEITFPENVTYYSSSIPVSFVASGGTIDDLWFNCDNASTWVYASNQTYSGVTYMTGFINGTYTFYAWANNTIGDIAEETIMFTVEITVNLYGIDGVSASIIIKINGVSVTSVTKINGEP